MIYGAQGSGKTTLGAQSADVGKTALINCEGGMLSVKSNPNLMMFNINNPVQSGHVWFGRDRIDRVESIVWAMISQDTKAFPWLAGMKTLMLDSGTEFLNAAIEDTVLAQMKLNPRRKDPTDIWQEDYGKVNTRLTTLFRQMREMPYNVIITALPRSEMSKPKTKDEQATVLSIAPSFTPKLKESIMGFFDHVWYLYKNVDNTDPNAPKITVSMITQPVGLYFAKTRGTAFPSALGISALNPTFKGIYDLLQRTEAGA